MDMHIKFPFYSKLTLILLGLISIMYVIFVGQNIIVPIVMSFLFAILLEPIVYFLKSKIHFPHVLGVLCTVLLFVLLIIGLFIFLSYKISDFVSDVDKIEQNIHIHIQSIQQFIKTNFHLSSKEQNEYLSNATEDSMKKGKEIIGSTLISFTDTVLNITLIPIYTFLILLYKTHFLMFLSKLIKKQYHTQLRDILNQIKVAVKSYIIGLIIEMIAVATLTTIGFMIIGVKYAILLGVITGILNLIPYIGILFAGILSILASLTGSPDLSIIIGVIIVNSIVQLIDNNILTPMVVSSKVEINAFVSIIGIIIGGAIAGISGMFLAIPILAILKVIFDRIESLTPWGYLMGDHLPKTYTWRNIKLPLFDSETSSNKTVLLSDVSVPIFTENTTESSTNKMGV
jgi:predicted PurR-regulated permease PerM